ncbi:helix-turn-helix domain-containing protein [Chitinophaga polysaccharea]|uniref:helix-turn-helix domain-containing protein n=1 Tax=Chitinophaga polysaccharea TaxID=1293035 RepID=UPI0011A90384
MLTLEEFCSYTGIAKSYAYKLTSSGKIKFYRPFGKLIYFDIEDVVSLLKQNSVESIDCR